jgi:hypothetical protein
MQFDINRGEPMELNSVLATPLSLQMSKIRRCHRRQELDDLIIGNLMPVMLIDPSIDFLKRFDVTE